LVSLNVNTEMLRERRFMTALSSDDPQRSDENAGYRSLWAAVLNQCWGDAVGGNGSRPYEETEARNFLLSNTAYWRSARELVCSLAGLDPEIVHDRAVAKLATTSNDDPAPEIRAAIVMLTPTTIKKVGAPQTHGACRPRADADLDVPPNFRYWR